MGELEAAVLAGCVGGKVGRPDEVFWPLSGLSPEQAPGLWGQRPEVGSSGMVGGARWVL